MGTSRILGVNEQTSAHPGSTETGLGSQTSTVSFPQAKAYGLKILGTTLHQLDSVLNRLFAT